MFKQISHLDADQLFTSKKNMVIADVRHRESFDEAHIKNAIHLSITKLQDFCAHADKNQPILVYCYHGIGSQSVAQYLLEQGFSEVYSLLGGFETWKIHHPTSDAGK